MRPATALLCLVSLQRLGELALARRNTARLKARGAHEVAPGHYPMIVGLHAAWLASLWSLGRRRRVNPAWLATFLALQAGRAWVLASLGERWTTRILILPGETLVRSGPYRFIRHPNYAVVAGEIAALPLALGLPRLAAIASAANAAALAIRIRAEERALEQAPTKANL
ncbi:MAG TPA: isoprenylcysteine carboxylmethyltransferase family protein, partial [Caulobacteraceae bacterium]